ncbi:hypothetical protein H0H93_010321 [Arthromyces matolae]|nr:hypothetical protein H0H93_010321 [Arthromyces matolae]
MKPSFFVQLLVVAPFIVRALPIEHPIPNDLLVHGNLTPSTASVVNVRDDLIFRSDIDTALVPRRVNVKDIAGVTIRRFDDMAKYREEIKRLRILVAALHANKDLHTSRDAKAKANKRLAEEIYRLLGEERVHAEKDLKFISPFQKDYNKVAPWMEEISRAYGMNLKEVQDLSDAMKDLNAPF